MDQPWVHVFKKEKYTKVIYGCVLVYSQLLWTVGIHIRGLQKCWDSNPLKCLTPWAVLSGYKESQLLTFCVKNINNFFLGVHLQKVIGKHLSIAFNANPPKTFTFGVPWNIFWGIIISHEVIRCSKEEKKIFFGEINLESSRLNSKLTIDPDLPRTFPVCAFDSV